MDERRKHQVSLRGASAKEITRDALIEKVSQERELRQYARRASSAALFIQRVWRRYRVTKMVAWELREEWEKVVNQYAELAITATWLSSNIVRHFLFFITCLSTRHRNIQPREIYSTENFFQILLESVTSTDSVNNFCSLAIGTVEERRVWSYQSRRMISLCMFILLECDKSRARGQNIVALTSLAMRFVVVLSDLKGWKSVTEHDCQSADTAVKDLVWFMGSSESGLYLSIRTLALRPFHVAKFDLDGLGLLDIHYVAEKYCVFLLTVPCLTQRLPALLISAMRHKSILAPCFQTLLVMADFERENIKGNVRCGSVKDAFSSQGDSPSWLGSCNHYMPSNRARE